MQLQLRTVYGINLVFSTTLFLIILMFLDSSVSAQELITNGSFQQVDSTLKNMTLNNSSIEMAAGWYGFTVDLYGIDRIKNVTPSQPYPKRGEDLDNVYCGFVLEEGYTQESLIGSLNHKLVLEGDTAILKFKLASLKRIRKKHQLEICLCDTAHLTPSAARHKSDRCNCCVIELRHQGKDWKSYVCNFIFVGYEKYIGIWNHCQKPLGEPLYIFMDDFSLLRTSVKDFTIH